MFLRVRFGLAPLALVYGTWAALIASPGVVRGETILDRGHVDIGIGFANGEWDLHVHDDETGMEYEPGEVILRANLASITTRPLSSAFDFIGVGPGQKYWRLPFSEIPDVLYLGVGSEEIDPALFGSWNPNEPSKGITTSGRWLQLSLVDVRGAGVFSVWTSGDTGPLVMMTTSDGISAADSLYVLAGSHTHFNWGFSRAGMYEVDFKAGGFLANGQWSESGVVTYRFQAVPEPSALALFGAGSLITLVSLRRRLRPGPNRPGI